MNSKNEKESELQTDKKLVNWKPTKKEKTNKQKSPTKTPLLLHFPSGKKPELKIKYTRGQLIRTHSSI